MYRDECIRRYMYIHVVLLNIPPNPLDLGLPVAKPNAHVWMNNTFRPRSIDLHADRPTQQCFIQRKWIDLHTDDAPVIFFNSFCMAWQLGSFSISHTSYWSAGSSFPTYLFKAVFAILQYGQYVLENTITFFPVILAWIVAFTSPMLNITSFPTF